MAAVQQMVDDMGGGYSLEWGGRPCEEARVARKLSCCTHWPLPLYSWYWLLYYESWSIRWRLSLSFRWA